MRPIEPGTRENLLLVFNVAPYGGERTYNGPRLAGTLSRREGVGLRIFLVGDAVASAKSGQRVRAGHYNPETMLAAGIRHGAAAGVCGTCIDTRGIAEAELTAGDRRSTKEERTSWTLEADKVIVF